MIVLDTNVISELLRPDPEPRVMRWFTAWPRSRLFPTTITRSEVLSFDNDASDSYVQIAVGRRLATRNIKDFEVCDVVLINPWGHREGRLIHCCFPEAQLLER